MTGSGLEIHPLTPDRWDDLAALFGPSGAHGGCWCMFNRLKSADFSAGQGAANREAFRSLVAGGEVPGILAYSDGEPVGWCAVSPRSGLGRIERSPVVGPIDDVPVWAIHCFFVRRDRRGDGIAAALLSAAVEHARRSGAFAVEGYPLVPRKDRVPDMYAFHGLEAMFIAAGFEVVGRRKPARPIYRRML